jgi:hypothetical protein
VRTSQLQLLLVLLLLLLLLRTGVKVFIVRDERFIRANGGLFQGINPI